MELSWRKIRLELKERFNLSHGSYDYRDSLLISLRHKGFTGYGECVGISYYHINLDEFENILSKIKLIIEKTDLLPPFDFYQNFVKQHISHPFLQSALDCAYWDLFGKLEHKSFSELNHISTDKFPKSTFTISILPIEEQIQKIEQSNWDLFKIKTKCWNKVEAKQLLNTGKTIALDANTAFTEQDCLTLQKDDLAGQFHFIEQPRPIGEFSVLDANGYANWMADEDFQNENSLLELKNHYKSLNIKLMKCGGLSPAFELIQKAKGLDYRVMMGCMTESSVGISAAIALAPLCDYADLDGANLIANDYARASHVLDGNIDYCNRPGLGIQLI